MRTFKDTTGREWEVKFDALKMRDIKQNLGVNLTDSTGKAFDDNLAGDPEKLLDALWIVVRKQAAERNVNQDDLWESLDGDSMEEATTAFLEALVDFFPRRKRSLMRSLRRKQEEMEEIGHRVATKRIDDPNLLTRYEAEVAEQMDKAVDQVLTQSASATDSPENAESDPKD